MTETDFIEAAKARLNQHYDFALPIAEKYSEGEKEPAWLRALDIASSRTRGEISKAYRLLYNDLLKEHDESS